MIEITFLARAERDFLRIYADAEERAPGGGERFSQEIDKVLALLAHMPRLGRVVGPPYRRVKLSKFAYSLLYVVESRRVFIHAIASNYDSLEQLLRRLRED